MIREVKLGDILEYEQPNMYIVKNTNYDKKFSTPVLTAGQSFILGYTNEKENIFKAKENPVIIFDDFTTTSKYVDFDFKVKSSAMKILKAREGINIKYIYYAMKNIKFDNQLHKRYWISEYSKIKLLLPDIKMQEKIVKELDLINKLLDYKKKQIKLFDQLIKSQFVEMFENNKFEKKNLGDVIIKITDGSHNPPKGVDERTEYVMLSSQNIIEDRINYNNVRYLSREDFERENKRTYLEKGDVLLTIVGTIGRTAIIDNEKNITLQRSVAVIKPREKIKSKYLVTSLKSDSVIKQLNKGSKGVAQKGIYLNDLKKIVISVPPLSLQNQFSEIVKQIDKQKFESMIQLKMMEKIYNIINDRRRYV